ncbi:hypothetical protein [Ralstonia solanacearum]|uniref:Uncharacterized protein n=1 Tax=Ralstonia solanacearum TaxID=305 RepID=A0A7X0Q4X8_RALSL|nr:hypothetical protein [Ralstonia solanacearum]MBB6581908.1 hypothetical protein [Ralstonia solanacearum]MBB6584723.1 hypothetical protein [Ralstonia solanacearum]MDB0524542.1 hypothetical protein [Ralstonia solanacearum]
MKNSVDTQLSTLPRNLIEKCGYLVYGEAKPSAVLDRFEAWYWIDRPGELPGSDPVRIAGPTRPEALTYATSGEAVAMALQYGVIVAGELPSQGGAA